MGSSLSETASYSVSVSSSADLTRLSPIAREDLEVLSFLVKMPRFDSARFMLVSMGEMVVTVTLVLWVEAPQGDVHSRKVDKVPIYL